MERIVIINHDEHELYIEDIPDEILDAPEWDDEEAYIRDNYDIEHFSWDFITDAYLIDGCKTINIDFDDIKDI